MTPGFADRVPSTIRQGRASSVTDLGDGRVLRLGGRPDAEAEMMRVAAAHGIRVPAVHDVRRDGLVMELVPGATMLDRIWRRPWLMPEAARVIAGLHERLHAIDYGGARLVHFDLHPDNVLLGPDGPVLIDWTNARGGDPDADVALTWLIAETSAGLRGRAFARAFRRSVGREAIGRGFEEAAAFRLADPHVTDAERARVRRLRP
jgi:tRNA A-37 threonylcarbamoyl transferase component Bud32